jgi:hypothetical protein
MRRYSPFARAFLARRGIEFAPRLWLHNSWESSAVASGAFDFGHWFFGFGFHGNHILQRRARYRARNRTPAPFPLLATIRGNKIARGRQFLVPPKRAFGGLGAAPTHTGQGGPSDRNAFNASQFGRPLESWEAIRR